MCTVPTAVRPVNPARTSRRNVQRFVRVMFALPTAGEYAVRIEERGPRSSHVEATRVLLANGKLPVAA